MENPDPPQDFAQLLARLKDTYGVSESEIARRIDVSPATVNNWVRRKRGMGRGPNPDKLRSLAAAFPKFTEDDVFAAVGRATPGPLNPNEESEVLDVFADLTAEQQKMTMTQMRALREDNIRGRA